MKDEDKVAESFEEAMKRIMARMPPEQRLAGLAPEQRLAGLAPEQRLAGLTEAQAVLALPDAVLRGLTNEYLAEPAPGDESGQEKRLEKGTGPHRATGGRRKAR
ncbi:MAG: hypothetical protein R3F14_35135 [Polyangiaceae bacterium]